MATSAPSSTGASARTAGCERRRSLLLLLLSGCGGAPIPAGRRRVSGRGNTGRPNSFPQKLKSSVSGSPFGHLQVRSVSWTSCSRREIGTTTFAIGANDGERPARSRSGSAARWRRSRTAWNDVRRRDALASGAATPSSAARRGRRPAAAGQLQPMNLADHGIAADAAQLRGDLAGAQPLGPKFAQKLDPFIVPVHETILLLQPATVRIPPRPGDCRGHTTLRVRLGPPHEI